MNEPPNPTTASTRDTDHKRGCAGREYSCTCGYDDAKDAEIIGLCNENAALRQSRDEWTDRAMRTQRQLTEVLTMAKNAIPKQAGHIMQCQESLL